MNTLNKLKKLIKEAQDQGEKINITDINDDTLAQLLPQIQPVEIEFYGRCCDEVGGTMDYEHGGIKDTWVADEVDTGYICLEHPFSIKYGKGVEDSEKWEISCSWATDHFEVKESKIVNTLQDVYDFIKDISQHFEDFELETIDRYNDVNESLCEQFDEIEFDIIKADVQELTDYNNHLDAVLLIAKTYLPEYVDKYQKFVDIAKKMQGFTTSEMKERWQLTQQMFKDLIPIMGEQNARELYSCL